MPLVIAYVSWRRVVNGKTLVSGYGVRAGEAGGACARRRELCARAPMLTLELDRVGLPGRRHDGRWGSLQMGCGRPILSGPVPVGG